MRSSKRIFLSSCALIGLASTAQAQDSAAPSTVQADETADTTDIVVTGSNIRGIAPAGTNVVNLSRESIVESGASTAMQALAEVPQVSNAFNQVPSVPSNFGVARVIVRPNIRNIGQASGGSSTLVLIDGHRAVPAGTLENTPDVDVIPAGVLERVDVVADGGSAIYGSDAVGGVINFITRRRFDGFEAAAHYGFADNYKTVDVNVTAGKDWGSGSAYLSYFFIDQDAIFGRDRDYVRQVTANSGSCAPGTVTVTRAFVPTTYALPNRVPGTRSTCDFTDNISVFPSSQRHSLFGAFNQDVSDSIELDVRAFYTKRKSVISTDLNQDGNFFSISPQTGTITPSNPYYVPIDPDPGEQSVAFSYAGVFNDKGYNDLDEYGVTTTVTADIGGDWQLRALGNWGRSHVEASTPMLDTAAQTAALAGTTFATALNPYNPGASNPAVLAGIYQTSFSPATQELLNFRGIFDGTVVTLPGGNARAAVGAEYSRQTYSIRQDVLSSGSLTPVSSVPGYGRREVKSVFGELSIPIVGADNQFGGVNSLVVNVSGRYDDYSDFGDTFNPKFAVTYKPVDWVSIRGNWGQSFNAPGLADSQGSSGAQLFAVSPFRAATSPFFNDFFRPTIILAGSNPNLRPQTADTWSVGIDLDPPVVPGLRISATYYNIHMKDIIGTIPFFSPTAYSPAYAAFITLDPTRAQSLAATAGLTPSGNFPNVDALHDYAEFVLGTSPYVLMDARQNNLGVLKQDGIDFNVNYRQETGFGSINAGIGGTYTLKRDLALTAGQPFIDDLFSPGNSDLSLLVSLGAQVGNLTGSARLNHSRGYDVFPALGAQTHVNSFNTVDLFFSYDFKGTGVLQDLSLTLNVNNVFDQDPPFYNQNNGYTNGSTLGRLVQFGIRKRI
jgi:iron complex outermembrane receptor protein